MTNGLNEREVSINRDKYGTNKIEQGKSESFFKLLLESLGDPIIKILLIRWRWIDADKACYQAF